MRSVKALKRENAAAMVQPAAAAKRRLEVSTLCLAVMHERF